MKQFFTYVLATIAGLWITIIIMTVGSILMTIVMLAASMATPTVKIDKKSVLHVCLDGPIEERAQGRSILEELQGISTNTLPLNDLVKAIDHAATDDKIEGIYLDCKGGSGGAASMAYIRESLEKFKESGKWIVAYGDVYTQSNYYLASLADSLWLNPQGSIDIHGVGGTLPFFKGLLDKLGVEMQVVKVGTYKSAVEPYIMTEPSEANREQIKGYITPIWNYISGGIASGRDVSVEEVNQWADSIIVTQDPATFAARGLVTSLKYRHEVEEWMKSATDKKKKDNLSLVSPAKYASAIKEKSSSNKIALLYASGDIVDSGNDGIVGDKMAPLILSLAEDDDIDALVLRVNSGGGSAFASEQIWEALEQFKATGKPFYVSMGDVAASGGYYISCGADRIYCQPVTITGSIGIFGLIPNIKGFLNDKLGLNMVSIATNPNANISITEPFTPVQRAAMQSMVNRGYETFVGRCAEGRGVSVDSIKAIAEGRVWDGTTALEIGLVDKLGSLTDCISDLAADQGYDKYTIVEYPDPKGEWWEELLMASSNVKQSLIKAELGEALPYYEAIQQVKKMSPVQCRMEYIVVE